MPAFVEANYALFGNCFIVPSLMKYDMEEMKKRKDGMEKKILKFFCMVT